MHLKILLIFVSFQLCVAILPVIYQADDTVIATEPVKASLPLEEHKFVEAVHYPYYEVFQGESKSLPSDRLPDDLVATAARKLGIQTWDELPSVSALGELLGTTSREETIDLLRKLTETESGIELIRAFIESSDYTDKTATTEEPVQIEADTSGPLLPTILLSETLQKDLDIAQKVLPKPSPELGFFGKIASFFGLFDLFPDNQEIPIAPVNKEVQEIQPRSHNKHHAPHHKRVGKVQPDSADLSVPDSFPVPVLPGAGAAYPSLLSYRPHPVREEEEEEEEQF